MNKKLIIEIPNIQSPSLGHKNVTWNLAVASAKAIIAMALMI
jgi:hypothetical protein